MVNLLSCDPTYSINQISEIQRLKTAFDRCLNSNVNGLFYDDVCIQLFDQDCLLGTAENVLFTFR